MNRLRWFIPLALFLVLAGFFWVGLSRDPHEVPSPLIGKEAPEFRLTQLHAPERLLSPADLRGRVWLLNVWASWCVSCHTEHPLLMELSRTGLVPVYGLDYKDRPEDGKAWLAQNGNPYATSIVDEDGRVGIDYGVYGVPETFLIDRKGVIRYKQIGPLTVDALKNKILPMVRELQK